MKRLITILLFISYVNAYPQFLSHFAHKKNIDTIKVVMLVSDTCKDLNLVTWKFGYAVRELHNTVEAKTSVVVCCVDYWEVAFYLDELKTPLPKTVIVWQSIPSNWKNYGKSITDITYNINACSYRVGVA